MLERTESEIKYRLLKTIFERNVILLKNGFRLCLKYGQLNNPMILNRMLKIIGFLHFCCNLGDFCALRRWEKNT
jgi:hypothetical protein